MAGPAPESRREAEEDEEDLRMEDEAVMAARDSAADLGRVPPPGVLPSPGVPRCLPADMGGAGMALLGRLLKDLEGVVVAAEEDPTEPPPSDRPASFKSAGNSGSRAAVKDAAPAESPLTSPPEEDFRRAT